MAILWIFKFLLHVFVRMQTISKSHTHIDIQAYENLLDLTNDIIITPYITQKINLYTNIFFIIIKSNHMNETKDHLRKAIITERSLLCFLTVICMKYALLVDVFNESNWWKIVLFICFIIVSRIWTRNWLFNTHIYTFHLPIFAVYYKQRMRHSFPKWMIQIGKPML
jgi:hypothetical protein